MSTEDQNKQTPPAGATDDQNKQGEQGKQTPPADEFANMSVEDLKARLNREISDRRSANDEAHKLRTDLNGLKKAEEDRKKAEMSETERLKTEKQELESRLAQEADKNRNTRIELAASKLDFADPSDAINFIDKSKIKPDESNLKDLLEDLLKAKPYLAKSTDGKPPKAPKTGGGNPGGTGDKAGENETVERAKSLFPTVGKQIGT